MKSHILAAAVAATLPLAAAAQTAAPAAPAAAPAAASAVTITDAFARSNNPDVGAVFMTIANAGTTDCVLTAATADGIGRPELHTHRDEGGVMKMVKVDSMTIPPGGTHDLKRGGDHIMLMEPAAPLAQGQEIALTLDFGACGKVPLSVTIDNAAGGGAMGGAGMHGTHGKGMGGGMGGQGGGMGKAGGMPSN